MAQLGVYKKSYYHINNALQSDFKIKSLDIVYKCGAFSLPFKNYYTFGMEMPGRTFSPAVIGAYRYGFNGKEKEGEISEGDYDLGARIFDTRIARMFTTDPREYEYSWQSPYAYFSNSPIAQLDFNGEGDYYGKDGKRLGSDGKTKEVTVGKGKDKKTSIVPDDKAYVCESVTIKDGLVVSANNSTDLGIANSELNLYANVIAQESIGNKEESYGIASAIINLKKAKGHSSLLSTYKKEGVRGYNDNKNGSTYMNNAEYGMEAAINALIGGYDYSNGAIRWDGEDFFTKGFSHNKSTYAGLDISEAHWSIFANFYKNLSSTTPASSGIHNATAGDNKGMVLYRSVAAHGGTIFWGKNPKSFIYGVQGPPKIIKGRVVPSGFFDVGVPVKPNSSFTGSW